MKRLVGVVVAATFGTAHAVYLNPRGLGQVLLYPYYTVNAGQATMISIVNTTPHGKALKVRFHEGYNGRDVLDFNVYLSPYDVWTAEIAQTSSGADAPATIQTTDTSCTVPQFSSADFLTFDYTGNNADTGPTSGARTREGHLNVIEMGEVTNAAHGSLTALTHVVGVPANCAQLVQAWTTGGYWLTDPTTDLSPPGGGLYGSESIIDVAQGTIYTIDAAAIDGFSSTILHTASGELTPDLNSANDSATAGTVTAFVPVGNKMLAASYQHPIDAVSALFMANTLYNEYDIDPAIGAQSEWMVTLPTKRFYVDPQIVKDTAALPPFDELFGQAVAGQSCAPVGHQIFDREEQTETPTLCGVPPTSLGTPLCFETSILPLNSLTSILGSQLVTEPISTPAPFMSGHIVLGLDKINGGCGGLGDWSHHFLAPSSNGYVFEGLPAFGFLARSYINANVTAGVLANYSGLLPHRASATCMTNTNPPNACE